jgi:hypothetical protein
VHGCSLKFKLNVVSINFLCIHARNSLRLTLVLKHGNNLAASVFIKDVLLYVKFSEYKKEKF